ncbi:ER protein Pkr1-domain-containing protein [Scheffersomyces amazonensis]|uniref:ER protein Pkr1-domain-containing protein n=1 Tax=Scheffersomyces amazonensis TaxID=1078765 RepID=UPI00315CF53E
MSFVIELWESIFTPGTSPALIKATHASFISLIISLVVLIFLTKSIHFFNLLVIAILLYGTVIWFINELKTAKLKDNKQLESESNEKVEEEKTEIATSSSVPESTPIKKRKV